MGVSVGNAEVPWGGDSGVGTLKHIRWANSVFWAENAEVMYPSKVGESGLPACRRLGVAVLGDGDTEVANPVLNTSFSFPQHLIGQGRK